MNILFLILTICIFVMISSTYVYEKFENRINSHTTQSQETHLDDSMLFFRGNKFKAECCPSSYTSSTGCACISPIQSNYLKQHGGNRPLQ